MDFCPICNCDTKLLARSGDYLHIDCPRCGQFKITQNAALDLVGNAYPRKKRIALSNAVRESGGAIIVATHNYKELMESRGISFIEKANNFIVEIEKATGFAGNSVSISLDDVSLQASSHVGNDIELLQIISFLESEGLIHNVRDRSYRKITIQPKGWIHIDGLKKPNSESMQGFVAMWFSDEMFNVYTDVMSEAIRDAGYLPHRVDQKEHAHRIDDEIISQIRRSRFVVADATGHRGGVYYEAGFAMGLGLPVFWTCRQGDELHFDVRQYNCIFWNSNDLPQFRLALSRRIEAVLGRGKS
uniref:Nucleoside 2-deoxyribosyltransferase n=1 Tax=Nitratidesulfovibrio vulgaris (strain DSM 19637 / Miyazaki F) TaxID=883 RepID=B8DLG1_NITV9